MVSTDDAEPRCPHCIGPLGPNDDFCKSCGGPVTSHASIDPLGQIYATGYAYRQAVSGRPRKIVVLGMWLIFGPQLLGAVSLLIVMLQGAVTGFDQFSLVLERSGQIQLIYKHAISTLQPAHPLDLEAEQGGEGEEPA